MMSDNLYSFIKERVELGATTGLLIIGKESDLDETVDLFLNLIGKNSNSTMVYYAAEIHNRNLSLENRGFNLVNRKRFKWTFKDEFLEVFGSSCFSEDIDGLWEDDRSRLTQMRIDRLLNSKISIFIFRKLKLSSSKYKFFIFAWPLLLAGLLLKFSRMKPKYDELLEFKDIKNNRIFLLRSQMYEKDHYGEAPLDINKRKHIVHACMSILSNYSEVGVMIFIGERVRWFREIEESIKKLNFSKANFFVFSAWRMSHKKKFKLETGGKFIAGSNTGLDNNSIFSPHCVGIGALDHELWYKEVSKSLK